MSNTVRVGVFEIDYDHEDFLISLIHDLKSVFDLIPVQWRSDARVCLDAVEPGPYPRLVVYYDRPKTQQEIDTDAAIAESTARYKTEKGRLEYLRLKAIYES